MRFGKIVGRVSEGMPWNGDRGGALSAEFNDFAILHRAVLAGDAGAITFGPNDLTAGGFFQLEISADMIVVMMRIKDVLKFPVFGFQRLEDRGGFAGIDCGDHFGFGIVKEVGIIILQAGNDFDVHKKLRAPFKPPSEMESPNGARGKSQLRLVTAATAATTTTETAAAARTGSLRTRFVNG